MTTFTWAIAVFIAGGTACTTAMITCVLLGPETVAWAAAWSALLGSALIVALDAPPPSNFPTNWRW